MSWRLLFARWPPCGLGELQHAAGDAATYLKWAEVLAQTLRGARRKLLKQ